MFIAGLTGSDLRRSDPFVAAVVGYFSDFPGRSGRPSGDVRGYLAGGVAVRCYSGIRTTGDIDMFFVGGRVLIAPNMTILVRADGRAFSLAFDHQYTPDFGLLHPDYTDRAVALSAPGDHGLPLSVLHPIDLAITKVARFQDHDRADIAALAGLGVFDTSAFTTLAEQAMAYAVGDLAFVRQNLGEAAEIVADAEAARS